MAENKQEVQSCPSYNPADLTTTAGMLDYIYRCNSMTTENCMPAIVESYDRNKNVVTVKPSINITAATGETIERESITATVMSVCGNKFIMNFPLEKGDTGWLITADRDISLFREQRKVINANTNRIHSIEDSFFIPDRVNDFKIDDEDKDNFVLQSLSRNLKITFSKDTIKIYAGPGKKDEKKSPETNQNETFITLKSDEASIVTTNNLIAKSKNANITADENVYIKAPNIKIEGQVTIEGDVNVSGNVTASDCIGGGKSLVSHVHGGVTNGDGTTGGPQ